MAASKGSKEKQSATLSRVHTEKTIMTLDKRRSTAMVTKKPMIGRSASQERLQKEADSRLRRP